MFTDGTERWDWLFGVVVTALVIGALYWIRSQPIEQKVVKQLEVQQAIGGPHIQGSEEIAYEEEAESAGEAPAIATVFECMRDGQRVLSDRPCGAGVSVVRVSEPNRMQAQDTRSLYTQPNATRHTYTSVPTRSDARAKPAVCDWIEAEKDRINARMRKGYKNGEWYRERLRQLSEQRHEAKCIR